LNVKGTNFEETSNRHVPSLPKINQEAEASGAGMLTQELDVVHLNAYLPLRCHCAADCTTFSCRIKQG
jgi:hypothetical protein